MCYFCHVLKEAYLYTLFTMATNTSQVVKPLCTTLTSSLSLFLFLLIHTCVCLFSIFSDHSSQSRKLISELGFLMGSNRVGRVCHIVCSRPCYILNRHLLAVSSRLSLAQDGGKLSGLSSRPALALPGFIQSLEGEAQNCAKSFL